MFLNFFPRVYIVAIMLHLHYVSGGHSNHDFGHHGRNGRTVKHNVGERGRQTQLAVVAVVARTIFKTVKNFATASTHGGITAVHSSIAIILMGKRELVALLILSSWGH